MYRKDRKSRAKLDRVAEERRGFNEEVLDRRLAACSRDEHVSKHLERLNVSTAVYICRSGDL